MQTRTLQLRILWDAMPEWGSFALRLRASFMGGCIPAESDVEREGVSRRARSRRLRGTVRAAYWPPRCWALNLAAPATIAALVLARLPA